MLNRRDFIPKENIDSTSVLYVCSVSYVCKQKLFKASDDEFYCCL